MRSAIHRFSSLEASVTGLKGENMPSNRLKPKVFVADDEKVIADTLVMILEQSGFDARAVYSGEEALAYAESFDPDLLISRSFRPAQVARADRLRFAAKTKPRLG
jgi:PleD family two-component response regulator